MQTIRTGAPTTYLATDLGSTCKAHLSCEVGRDSHTRTTCARPTTTTGLGFVPLPPLLVLV